jgi:hypothetical protein
MTLVPIKWLANYNKKYEEHHIDGAIALTESHLTSSLRSFHVVDYFPHRGVISGVISGHEPFILKYLGIPNYYFKGKMH